MTEKRELRKAAVVAIQAATEGGLTYVSPISAWEVGSLTALGRLQLLIRPAR